MRNPLDDIETKRKDSPMLQITETIVTNATYRGMKVLGDARLLTRPTKYILIVNWEGHVERVLTHGIDAFDISWFEPSDKGGLSLFLVGENEKVFAGCVAYTKEKEFVVVHKTDTSTHYDLSKYP